MNTAEINMTPSQEKSLEHCLIWMSMNRFYSDTYRFKKVNIVTCYGDLMVSIVIDNGIKDTIGYTCPSHYIFNIGKRGGIYILVEKKKQTHGRSFRKVVGNKALIFSDC